MMNHLTGHPAGPKARLPRAWHRRRAAAAGVICAMLVAGCGTQTYQAQSDQTLVAAQAIAMAANAGCVQATPLVADALGVLRQLQRGKLTVAAARSQLTSDMASIEKLARGTPDDVLQQSLANVYDAFTAFRAVISDPLEPSYPRILVNLTGTLAAFQRTCSVANPSFATGTQGWAAANANTALSRSATAHGGQWSLRVTNTGQSPAAAGFTNSPVSAGSTLKGSEQVGLWARAVAGTPTLTVQVQEMSGSAVLGSAQASMKLGQAFQFVDVTYRIRHPGASRLRVIVAASELAPGAAFLADDITIVRD
jgi:hypothetical protein